MSEIVSVIQGLGSGLAFIREWFPWLAGSTLFFALGGWFLTTSVGAPVLGFLLGTKTGRWLTFGMLVTASIAAAMLTAFKAGQLDERAKNLQVRSKVIRANTKDKGGWLGGVSARERAAEVKTKPTFWGRKK